MELNTQALSVHQGEWLHKDGTLFTEAGK